MKRSLLICVIVGLILLAMPAWALADDGTGDGHFVFGGNYVLRSGESLSGDLVVMGGSARLEQDSSVWGNVAIMGGSVDVAGQVSGDITILGGSVDLGSTAVVGGQVISIGGSVRRDPGAQVQGDVVEGERALPWNWPSTEVVHVRESGLRQVLGWIVGTILTVLGILALALLATLLLPAQTEQVMRVIQAEPVISAAAGLLTIIILPLLLILLLITCIGPLILGLAFAVAVLFGWIAVGLLLGRAILKSFKVEDPNTLVEVLIGVAILTLLSRVPCIGWLLSLMAASLGLGAVILTRFGTSSYPWPRMDEVAVTTTGNLPTPVEDITPVRGEMAGPEAKPAADETTPDQEAPQEPAE